LCLENTHPFARELWGSTWLFAHNGGLKDSKALALDHYRPIGTTDSERAFCWMLGRIRARYPEVPAAQSRYGASSRPSAESWRRSAPAIFS
jgi:predicted glutamine amidotransferase